MSETEQILINSDFFVFYDPPSFPLTSCPTRLSLPKMPTGHLPSNLVFAGVITQVEWPVPSFSLTLPLTPSKKQRAVLWLTPACLRARNQVCSTRICLFTHLSYQFSSLSPGGLYFRHCC